MKDLIIFTDSGDTLVDESTQEFDGSGNVLRAELIEGAGEMLRELRAQGYRIALVADGRTVSFRNVFTYLGLDDIFEERIISEQLGVEKPDELMFRTAMNKMGLTDEDRERIVMIGNNLKRDVLGANRMGITSILISFSPRYDMRPTCPEEEPDYVVAMPCEIPQLLSHLELQRSNRQVLRRENKQTETAT